MPLKFEPGSAWLYSLSFDVLGEVVARASRSSFPKVVADAIAKPLELQSLSFHAGSASDLATPYADGKPEPVRMTDGIYVPYHGLPVGALFAPSRALDPKSYSVGGCRFGRKRGRLSSLPRSDPHSQCFRTEKRARYDDD